MLFDQTMDSISVTNFIVKSSHFEKYSIGSVHTCRAAFLFTLLLRILRKKVREGAVVLLRHAHEIFWNDLNLRVSLIQWLSVVAAH